MLFTIGYHSISGLMIGNSVLLSALTDKCTIKCTCYYHSIYTLNYFFLMLKTIYLMNLNNTMFYNVLNLDKLKLMIQMSNISFITTNCLIF